jgi:hypothetical protein
VGYSSANIQPLANRQYEDENFEPNIAKDTHKPIDENAIRVFISYSKNNFFYLSQIKTKIFVVKSEVFPVL